MIVVTTPTGRIGRAVVTELLNQDEPVRLIVRDPARLSPAARQRFQIVTGSHRDPAVLDEALAGTDSLLWVMPADPAAAGIYDAYVTASVPGAEAVHRHDVAHVVIVSALGRGTGLYGGHVSASLAMEDLFRSTGAHVRALANPTFLDNLLWQIPSLRAGTLTGTLPADLRLPAVATRDIAAAATGLLVDHRWTGQGTLGVLGPEDLSANDMAAILSDTLGDITGTPIRYRRGSRDAARKALIEHGFSPAIAQAMIDMDVAKEAGIDRSISRTAANTTPTTLRQFATEVLAPALRA